MARLTASLNSSFLINVFKVKFTETFLSFAYLIASFKFSVVKFVAFALALKE
mgnify:CR=1 FL=1